MATNILLVNQKGGGMKGYKSNKYHIPLQKLPITVGKMAGAVLPERDAVRTKCGPLSAIEQAAKSLQGSGAAFVCLDCMGFSQHMKARVAALSGLPVLLPRTLAACSAAELLSEEERPPRTAQTAK